MRFTAVVGIAVLIPAGAALAFDLADAAKWASVEVVHYEVVGVVSDKHVPLAGSPADFYGDATDRVNVSLDWNKRTRKLVGTPTFRNEAGKVVNLEGIGPKCPVGKLNGPYEHFDIVKVKDNGAGAIELIGQRIHPDTQVTAACGSTLSFVKGALQPTSTFISPPDPTLLALGGMMAPTGNMRVSADGRSLIMKALNNNWVWTFTPTAK